MADVRSMLKEARAARRITHPHASYTSSGQLLCNLCEVSVKSEAAWGSHLHSTQHALRTSRQQDAAAARPELLTRGSKRKAADSESPEPETKRTKSARPSSGGELEHQPPLASEEPHQPPLPPQTEVVNGTPHSTALPALEQDNDIDADELAAFERELADLEHEERRQGQKAAYAGATISAAPKTAEEIAAEAREEQSAQRGRRDEEIEGEREDAARALEDEFEEMEGYEARVQKLRDKREALRKGSSVSLPRPAVETLVEADEVGGQTHPIQDGIESDNDDDDDDDEEYDDWTFGRP